MSRHPWYPGSLVDLSKALAVAFERPHNLNHFLTTALHITWSSFGRTAHVAALPVEPIANVLVLTDWRVHVPMPLLDRWGELSDEERVAIFVMATSATHPYEGAKPPSPALN